MNLSKLYVLLAIAALPSGLLGASAPAAASAPTGAQIERPSIMQTQDLAHRHDHLSLPADTTVNGVFVNSRPISRQPAATSSAATPSAAAYNNNRLSREVFGFAPYWELSAGNLSDIQYDKVSTIAYFGATYTGSGTFVSPDPGGDGYNSQALTDVVNKAHAAGDKVVITVKSFDNATISSIVNNSGNGQTAINQAIYLMTARSLDGINVDFEGSDSSLQQAYTSWIAKLSSQMHSQHPGSFLSVDTYSGAASWSGGFMRIDTLAPSVDAFFVMAYDMGLSNASAQGLPPTLPNAPLAGNYTYYDTLSVDQYITKAGAAKVILGVPYYGYKSSTLTSTFNASINTSDQGACNVNCAEPYSSIVSEFQCALSLARNRDAASATPWASWYSPATNDPCQANHNSIRELYYDDAASLGAKYDLVNNRGIRGMGMWALGFDHGSSDLWNVIAQKFLNPDNQWSGWFWLGGNVTGPDVATNADGRLEAFGLSPDHSAWHSWQQTAGGGWSAPASLGGSLLSSPRVGRNADGRLELFAEGADGSAWHNWENVPGGRWSGWFGLGGGIVGSPTVTTDADGRLELLALGNDHAVYHAWQQSPGSGWTGWYQLGGSMTSVPNAGRNADGRLEIFARGTDGSAWHAWQLVANGPWSGWSALGGQIAGSPTVGTNADGRLEAFAITPDGQSWHDWQTSAGSGWFGWAPLGGSLTGAPAVARTPGGRLFIFGTNLDGSVWRKIQTVLDGGWGGWTSTGGPGLVNVAVGTNSDGRLELVAQDRSGSFWHDWQSSPST
ncbi:MAG TPA: glycosyl hydrolase family 18 protein [Candidatus Solibacter sp.]|jgi:spore germination protein YaaH|nr:glycosyl hydrolase family 18 protein [Candidatus Solibacter sp.]